MGKTLHLGVNDINTIIKRNLNLQTIQFIIDPRNLFTYDDLKLDEKETIFLSNGTIKIFYSIKIEASLRMFLARMLQYTVDHNESTDSNQLQYIVYVFDTPLFKMKDIEDFFREQIQQTNLILYIVKGENNG